VSSWKCDGSRLQLTVEVPPNTTATVFVPAKAADAVTESGVPATRARGVSFVRFENGAAVYRVGSGTYEFAS
jgi:alpha-L-rhamnosidase